MILIDISHAIYRTLMANKEKVMENYNFLSHLLLDQIINISSKFGASKTNQCIIACDSKNSWRKKYFNDNKIKFPELNEITYKGNRTKDVDLDWNLIFEIINNTLQAVDLYTDFKVIKIDGAEGDDVIAVLTNEYKNQETIWIVSSDKDFIQLQDTPRVNIYDPLKLGFKPEQNVEIFKKIHVMIGDKSDNIPSFKPRVQEKTALKLLKDLDSILATDPNLRERYQFNEKLILFEHIPDNIKNNIIDTFIKSEYTFNGMKLLTEFSKLKVVKHSENLQKFKLADSEVKTKLNQHFKELETTSYIDDFFS